MRSFSVDPKKSWQSLQMNEKYIFMGFPRHDLAHEGSAMMCQSFTGC